MTTLHRHFIRLASTLTLGFATVFSLAQTPTQTCFEEGFAAPESWTESFPAHRIIGPLYAVGGADLSVFLIATEEGHLLINTGLAASTQAIKANVEALGFQFSDIRILLTMQAHFDHTAAMAEIQSMTQAEVWATAGDARVLADGGASDAHFGECAEFRFPPVTTDRILADQDLIELGNLKITTHLHPGHTEGSSSYSLAVEEDDRLYNVLIANMGTINPGKKMIDEPTYPGVAEDFAGTFAKQKALSVDVWVAAHASQYQRDAKFTTGQAYDPDTFVDPAGFLSEVERLEAIYQAQIRAERMESTAQ